MNHLIARNTYQIASLTVTENLRGVGAYIKVLSISPHYFVKLEVLGASKEVQKHSFHHQNVMFIMKCISLVH